MTNKFHSLDQLQSIGSSFQNHVVSSILRGNWSSICQNTKIIQWCLLWVRWEHMRQVSQVMSVCTWCHGTSVCDSTVLSHVLTPPPPPIIPSILWPSPILLRWGMGSLVWGWRLQEEFQQILAPSQNYFTCISMWNGSSSILLYPGLKMSFSHQWGRRWAGSEEH